AKPPQAASKVLTGFDLYVSLAGLIDPAKEKARLEKQLAEKTKLVQSKEAKLANEVFIARAPAEVVQIERDAVAEPRKQIAALEHPQSDADLDRADHRRHRPEHHHAESLPGGVPRATRAVIGLFSREGSFATRARATRSGRKAPKQSKV